MRGGEGPGFYDALDLVLRDRLNQIQGSKAIVLMTDGVDTRSLLADSSSALAAVEESNVLVYAIQYDTRSENNLKPPARVSGWMIVPADARQNDERYLRADGFLYNLSIASGGELILAGAITNLRRSSLTSPTNCASNICFAIILRTRTTTGHSTKSGLKLRAPV